MHSEKARSKGIHICNDKCVCPIHETDLLYSKYSNEHACQDIDCIYGHGFGLQGSEKRGTVNIPEKPKQKIERELQLTLVTGKEFTFDIVIDEENFLDFINLEHSSKWFSIKDITQYPGDSFTHYSIETWTQ